MEGKEHRVGYLEGSQTYLEDEDHKEEEKGCLEATKGGQTMWAFLEGSKGREDQEYLDKEAGYSEIKGGKEEDFLVETKGFLEGSRDGAEGFLESREDKEEDFLEVTKEEQTE